MKHIAPLSKPRRAQDELFNDVLLFRILVAVVALFKQDLPI